MMYMTEANLAQKLVFKGKIITRNMCYKYINAITHKQNTKIGKATGYYHFPNMKTKDALKDITFVDKKYRKLERDSKNSFTRFKIAVDNIYKQYEARIIERIKKKKRNLHTTENDIEKDVKDLFEKEHELATELAEKYAEDILFKEIDVADDKSKKEEKEDSDSTL